ncbi:MAG TPA: hypothetical protein VK158_04430 [Acidobacteriota bacterium]|nr:hypothetical protein [Acidobacteriota bacterium]
MKQENTRPLEVLIIEENPEKREELVNAMSLLGAKSTVAVSPYEIAPFKDHGESLWDVIITKFNPKGMNAKRYYDLLRERSGTQPVVVVADRLPYRFERQLQRDRYAAALTQGTGINELYNALRSIMSVPHVEHAGYQRQ